MDCQYGGIRERLDEMLATAAAERLAHEAQQNHRAEERGRTGPLARIRLALFAAPEPKPRVETRVLHGGTCEHAASHH